MQSISFDLQPPDEVREGEEGEDGEAEEEVVYTYTPPEAKEWKSLGSEKAIKEENVQETRGKVCLEIKLYRLIFSEPYWQSFVALLQCLTLSLWLLELHEVDKNVMMILFKTATVMDIFDKCTLLSTCSQPCL